MANIIAVAGATGHLGSLITRALRERGATVRSITRPDYRDRMQLKRACEGATCVVSALAGPRNVIIDRQTELLEAAIAAGAARFIPSDFAIDFYKMPDGYNRNLDLRREFATRLDASPIRSTSILNGMFMELLQGQAPFILQKFGRVLYWENADQPMDFTTAADTANYTAAAALDSNTPRFLRIAGDVASARDLARIATDAFGKPFKLFRPGKLSRLEKIIAFMQRVQPAENEVYPPWQGMQYMHNMYDGRAKLEPLDNDRYPDLKWTSVREVISPDATASQPS